MQSIIYKDFLRPLLISDEDVPESERCFKNVEQSEFHWNVFSNQAN